MKPEVSLLALIHQHLLQTGYKKAAKKLQTQSGQKFLSSNISLQDIYTNWINHPENAKKRKATKTNDLPSKKLRVSDPVSSSETSEDEKNLKGVGQGRLKAPPLVAQAKEKKARKRVSKVKTLAAPLKDMNSVNPPEAKQKPQPKKVEPPTNKNASTLTAPIKESSDSSDHEEETKMVAPAPATLKPVLEDSSSNETSSSDESEMEVDHKAVLLQCSAVKSIPDIVAGKKTPNKGPTNGVIAHQAKDAAKPDASDSSDSDSTDIENTKAIAAPPMTPGSPSKGAKQLTVKTPLSVLADNSEDSDSDSDKEPVAKKAAVSPQASKGKTRTSSKAVKQTLAPTPAKTPLPVSQLAGDSSDDSDDEDEPHKVVTPQVPLVVSKVKTSISSKAVKQPVSQTPAKTVLPMLQQADSSSGTSDSESEEEPVSKVVAPVQETTVKTQKRSRAAKEPVTQVKVPLPLLPSADNSSEDSDSDGESEPEAKKVVAPPQAPNTKAITSPKAVKQPVTPAPTQASVPMQQPVDDSSEDSDSEEEVEPQKVLPAPKASKPEARISSKAIKLVIQTPAKVPLPTQQSSDDSDSESEEETEVQKAAAALQATKAKTTASSKSTKQSLMATPAKIPLPSQQPACDSSEESDSESEEEQQTKHVVPLLQATKRKTGMPSKTARQPMCPTPLKSPLPIQQSAGDGEQQEAKKVQAKKGKTITSAKAASKSVTPIPAKPPVQPASDSSSDSEEEPETKIVTPPQANKGKTSTSSKAAKQSVTQSPVKTPVPAQQLADDSSDESSTDSEEEPDAKKVVAPPPATKGKTNVTSVAANQSKTPNSAEVPMSVQQPADDSSDDSSSDSEVEPEAKKVVAPPQETKGKPNTTKVYKQTITPANASKAVKRSVTAVPAKAPVQQPAVDSSDSDTDSEEEPEVQAKTPVPAKVTSPKKAIKVRGSAVKAVSVAILPVSTAKVLSTVASSAKEQMDSDTSSSDDDTSKQQTAREVKKVLPTPIGIKSTLGKKISSPLLSSTPFDNKLALGKGGSPAKASVILKPSMAEISSSSDDSDSDDAAAPIQISTPSPVTTEKNKQKVPSKNGIKSAPTKAGSAKGKVASPSTVPVVHHQVTSESSETSDSEEESSVKPGNPSTAEKSTSSQISAAQSKLSQPPALAVTSSSSDDSSDSELETSQALLKMTPLPAMLSPQKPKTDKKTKTKPAATHDTGKKKSPSKVKSKPLAPPAQLSMLESEEETVQALLEGRSPKKNKVKKSESKKVVEHTLITDRTSHDKSSSKNGLAAEHPQTLPLAIAPTSLPQSEKKSSKKRKLVDVDGVAVKKAKVDKKAKKDKKQKKSKSTPGEAGLLTPNKPSKKDKKKSKSKKKKKDSKDKKKGKKKVPASTPKVEGVPSSSTNAVSKPKKKKTKTEKSELLTH